MNPVFVAVVGGGHLGQIHARLLHGMVEAQLVGVVDPSPIARQNVIDKLGVPAVADIRDLSSEIEAIVLAAPTSLHVPLGLQCVNRGLHVLVEKPLAPAATEALQLLRAAQQRGVVLQVGHVEQFNPVFEKLRPQLAGCHYIQARRCGAYSSRSTDVSVVLDLMIHDIDLLLSLLPSPPRSIAAWGTVSPGPHWDAAQARITFQDGVIVDLLACRTDVQADRVWQVMGDGWYGRLDLVTRCAHIVAGPAAERGVHRAELSPPSVPLQVTEFLPPADANPLREELRNFLRSVRGLELPRVPGAQGWRALVVAQQIEEQLAASAPAPHPWRRAG